ncbi:hypothetical protein BGX30_006239 [Mortierella sp. GBA39]|nr:hypothetical protein BGX30_006239 [Mortierella sp. GBA39]
MPRNGQLLSFVIPFYGHAGNLRIKHFSGKNVHITPLSGLNGKASDELFPVDRDGHEYVGQFNLLFMKAIFHGLFSTAKPWRAGRR